MSNPFTVKFEDLPDQLPIFPLGGAILLPGAQLPLNIFEPRYLRMVMSVLGGHRMIGMIQPRVEESGSDEVCQTGCAGRITSFSETQDGRLLIVLKGVCRFDVREELAGQDGYRRISPTWSRFVSDMGDEEIDLDRPMVAEVVKSYLSSRDSAVDWEAASDLSDLELLDTLAVNLPFSMPEKQAFVETVLPSDRLELLVALCRFGDTNASDSPVSRH